MVKPSKFFAVIPILSGGHVCSRFITNKIKRGTGLIQKTIVSSCSNKPSANFFVVNKQIHSDSIKSETRRKSHQIKRKELYVYPDGPCAYWNDEIGQRKWNIHDEINAFNHMESKAWKL